MKLFLDDIRSPQECASYMHHRIGKLNPIYIDGNWFIVRNYNEFVMAIEKYHNEITHISYDHDLADEHYTTEEYWDDFNRSKEYQEKQNYKEKTGLDCAKFMKQFYKNMRLKHPVMFVHSMNPVGTQNIIDLFK